MRLKSVFIRFYKSFNYDYLKKYQASVIPKPWEIIDNFWYPYIQIKIDNQVTTIVGENESGKTHLLTAIEKAISGIDYQKNTIKREDFCRYSQFFYHNLSNIFEQNLRYPDFGTEWTNLTEIDQNNLRSISTITTDIYFNQVYFFRENKNKFTLYLQSDVNEYLAYPIKPEYATQLLEIFPQTLRINSKMIIPDSFSVKQLLQRIPEIKISGSRYEFIHKKQRAKVRESLDEIYNFPETFKRPPSTFRETNHSFDYTIESLIDALRDYGQNYQEIEQENQELDLVYKLICQVAKVDPSLLVDLANSMITEKIGYTNGLIEIINKKIAHSLNFAYWWGQDQEFQLLLSPRDHDLVFTIKDRTNTQYSLGERSSGLKYFLSYYIQYRSYQEDSKKPEILLMDEPDTYLSSKAQQDLLKILEGFTYSPDLNEGIQVIYVTHSPFFINKNYPQRIRYLEKGREEEGTIIVTQTAKNSSEILQSSFGQFTGEITIFTRCNLIVNSLAEKVLLGGISTYLHQIFVSEREKLDLNHINIIPVGNISYLPSLLTLNDHNNIEPPAVIILLNTDEYSEKIKQDLISLNKDQKISFDPQFILSIEAVKNQENVIFLNLGKLTELEDMIPLTIAVKSAKFWLVNYGGLNQSIANKLTENLVSQQMNQNLTLFKSIQTCIKIITHDQIIIDRLGFNRSVVDLINQQTEVKSSNKTKIFSLKLKELEHNFKILFSEINQKKRDAQNLNQQEKLTQKISRIKQSFIKDYPLTATKEAGLILLENIEKVLETNNKETKIKSMIEHLKKQYQLNQNLTQLIQNYEQFKEDLNKIKYAKII